MWLCRTHLIIVNNLSNIIQDFINIKNLFRLFFRNI